MTRESIEDCVRRNLEQYFLDLDGAAAHGVYDMVMHAVEKPTLEIAMAQAGGNQSQAATLLGINRNTLRKKLAQHGLL